MPVFEIKTPDGRSFEVDAPNAQAAYEGLQNHLGGPAPAVGQPSPRLGQIERANPTSLPPLPPGFVLDAPEGPSPATRDANGQAWSGGVPVGGVPMAGAQTKPAQPAGAPDIRVHGPDGSTFSFPEGTPEDTINSAMRGHYGGQAPSGKTHTLNIGGRKVTVDDTFMRLSPDEQNETVDEIAASLGIKGNADGQGLPPLPSGFVLDDAAFGHQPRAPQFSGPAMNASAGANESLYGLAGLPVDAMRGAMNLGIRGFNAVTGSDVGQIPEDSFGGSRFIGQTMGAIRPELDPQNTVARTTDDKIARGVGQGVAGTVAPAGAVAGLARAGTLAPRAAGMAEAVVGAPSSVSNAVLGATSGAGGAIGQEIAPEGYEQLGALAGGMAGGIGGAGAMAAARGGQAVMRPFTSGGQQRMAGERILTGASDPAAVRQSVNSNPDQLVPGSQPTTFQQTGDLGLGVMEKNAANRQPEAFAQRRADQNEARIGAMRGIEPAGAPEKVAASVRQHLEGIEADTERMIAEATDAARSRTSAIGSPMTPDVAGGNMRGAIEAARERAKVQERALWSAVDPDGTMALGLSNTRQTVAGITKDHSSFAQPMTDPERQIYGAIGSAGEMVPLRAMQDLQSNLKAAMRAERSTNGESPAYRRMSILSAGIAKDFDAAVAGKVAQEAQAVAEGRLAPENTMEARWRARAEAELAGRAEARAAGGDSGTGAGFTAASGSPSVPGQAGAGRQAGGRSGSPAGDPRLSVEAGAPLFDGAAQERLSAANAATRERAQTFDNDTLAPFRQRSATNGPYDNAAGTLPQRIFSGSKGSFEAIGQLRAAIGPQAADDALQGYATGELLRVAGRPDGTIDPAKLASFRRTHSDALRALPGLDARLSDAGRASEAIAEVATARAAASRDAQKGALSRLIGVDAPEDVTGIVGGVFSAQDGVARMQSIRQAIGNDPEAAQGLRRAVIEHMAGKFIGNTEAATSGLGTMKADGFQSFARQNRAALEVAGFSGDDLHVLDAIAADLHRSGRSISGVKNPGGSDTAQNLYGAMRGSTPFSALARFMAAPGAAGVGLGLANGTTTGLAAGAVAGVLTAMRNAGLRTVDDLVADALLNPERARLLLSKVPEAQEGARIKALARSFANTAARAAASPSAADSPERGPMRLDPKRLGSLDPATRKSMAVAQALGIRPPMPSDGKISPVAQALFERELSKPADRPTESALARALAERKMA